MVPGAVPLTADQRAGAGPVCQHHDVQASGSVRGQACNVHGDRHAQRPDRPMRRDPGSEEREAGQPVPPGPGGSADHERRQGHLCHQCAGARQGG